MDISGETVIHLAEEYGDAFYLLDLEQFRNNYDELKKAFQAIYPHFNIAYSYKTNYIPAVCRVVDELGGYAEVVSEMELEIAFRIGIRPENIIWNGPVKDGESVRKFLLDGGLINIDSADEARAVRDMAAKHQDVPIKIGIRCNFDVRDGLISRFGIDVSSKDFQESLEIINEAENIRLFCLQCHFAKRNLEYWPARAKGMVDIAREVEDFIGYVPDRIDLGGGIYGNMPESLKKQFPNKIPDYTDYAEAAAEVLYKAFPDARPELVIEPGSALVGDCMKFVACIEGIKNVRGRFFATVMGSQGNIRMSGINPPIEIVAGGGERKQYEGLNFVGYTCIEDDVLYRGYSGPLAVGDYIVISNCGSYSVVMKPPFIMPNFPVIALEKGIFSKVKSRERFDNIFQTYEFG